MTGIHCPRYNISSADMASKSLPETADYYRMEKDAYGYPFFVLSTDKEFQSLLTLDSLELPEDVELGSTQTDISKKSNGIYLISRNPVNEEEEYGTPAEFFENHRHLMESQKTKTPESWEQDMRTILSREYMGASASSAYRDDIEMSLLQRIADSTSDFPIGWNMNALPGPLAASFSGDEAISGVTTSMVYFGSRGTRGPMHVEDGDLPSANVLFPKSAPKVWLGFHSEDQFKINDLVQKLTNNRRCGSPLLHKNIMFDIDFMENNGIRWFFCIQNPGDVVITNPGGFHQVINLGYNIAEATNFYCYRHLVTARRRLACACSERISRYNDVGAETWQHLQTFIYGREAEVVSSFAIAAEETYNGPILDPIANGLSGGLLRTDRDADEELINEDTCDSSINASTTLTLLDRLESSDVAEPSLSMVPKNAYLSAEDSEITEDNGTMEPIMDSVAEVMAFLSHPSDAALEFSDDIEAVAVNNVEVVDNNTVEPTVVTVGDPLILQDLLDTTSIDPQVSPKKAQKRTRQSSASNEQSRIVDDAVTESSGTSATQRSSKRLATGLSAADIEETVTTLRKRKQVNQQSVEPKKKARERYKKRNPNSVYTGTRNKYALWFADAVRKAKNRLETAKNRIRQYASSGTWAKATAWKNKEAAAKESLLFWTRRRELHNVLKDMFMKDPEVLEDCYSEGYTDDEIMRDFFYYPSDDHRRLLKTCLETKNIDMEFWNRIMESAEAWEKEFGADVNYRRPVYNK